MRVLKCSICGGEIEINTDKIVGVCQYCDSTIVIPKELAGKGNLYNRAVFLRQNNEFDKAIAVYEDILKEDNTDAEAHWGLVLSKYGIEYVSDPYTGERIPTCHRLQPETILSDPDYIAALEYSAPEARDILTNEARRINQIQMRIIEISQKESPYDIFICYKETDESGSRTEDSIIAQDLYYELTKKGYSVFFARKTLENKLGDEYESVIYAALSSAKIMIVIGAKPEHFNAVWVRNEWSRFIKMSAKSHKTIIPAYRGFSPYELPVELSSFQSQDMSKIGFMQDLTDGIERHMRGENDKQKVYKENVNAEYAPKSIERLLQNGQTYLKLNNYESAHEVYTTITKDYPENYRGWWGLIICATKNFSKLISDQSSLNTWFGYTRQLADPKDFAEIEKTYIDYTGKISLLDAENDIKYVNAKIAEKKIYIADLEQHIQSEEYVFTERKRRFEQQEREFEEKIESCKQEIPRMESLKKRQKNLLYFGFAYIVIFLIGFSVLNSIADKLLDVYWIFFILILGIGASGGACLMIGYNFTKIISKDSPEKIMKSAQKKRQICKKEFDKAVSEYNKSILAHEAILEEFNNQIEKHNKYLAYGTDNILLFHLAKRCAEFGVQKPIDAQISELRIEIFSNKEQTEQ